MIKSVIIGAISLFLPSIAIEQQSDEAFIDAVDEISQRIPLSERVNGFDKYSNFVDKTTNFKPTMTVAQIMMEKIWGKDR
jgi:hypothetical protein